MDERVEVLSGTLGYRVNDGKGEVGAGAVSHVPRGTPHIWWNTGDDELHMLVAFEPALRTAEFFESFYSLAQQGCTDARTGMPDPLQTAVIANEFAAEVRLAKPPAAVPKVLLGTLAPLGRWLGYRARHSYPVAKREVAGLTRPTTLSDAMNERRRPDAHAALDPPVHKGWGEFHLNWGKPSCKSASPRPLPSASSCSAPQAVTGPPWTPA